MAEPQTQHGCTRIFNGLDGEYGKSASLWLAYLHRHREIDSSPSNFLKQIDRLLEGEAARWLKNTESVRTLIWAGYMGLATESDIVSFRGALTDRFKLIDKEARDLFVMTPAGRLSQLRQGPSEDLEQYYNRTRDILLDLHGDDDESDTLAPPLQSLRRIVVTQFVRRLRDRSSARLYSRLCKQHIFHDSVSLYEAFKIVEAEMKNMGLDTGAEGGTEDSKEKKQEQMIKKLKRKLATDETRADYTKKPAVEPQSIPN